MELRDLLARCESANGDAPITFFEITTAAAMLAFTRHPADILLLEVGLGGRLDATNVVETPAISVITPVSIDHTQFLGDDLAGIAAEKAGILKPGVPAVIAPQTPAAMEPITSRAEAVGAPLIRCGVEWDYETQPTQGSLKVRLQDRWIDLGAPSLHGHHQFVNAAAAAVTLLSLPGFTVDIDDVRRGLKEANWPGRLQRIEGGPLNELVPAQAQIWLDGGHNPSAGEALAATLSAWKSADPADVPVYLVTGMLNTKDVSAYFAPFAKAGTADCIFGITIDGEAASRSGEDVAEAARQIGIEAHAAGSLDDALRHIASRVQENPARIIVCGSLYLAGQVLARQE